MPRGVNKNAAIKWAMTPYQRDYVKDKAKMAGLSMTETLWQAVLAWNPKRDGFRVSGQTLPKSDEVDKVDDYGDPWG